MQDIRDLVGLSNRWTTTSVSNDGGCCAAEGVTGLVPSPLLTNPSLDFRPGVVDRLGVVDLLPGVTGVCDAPSLLSCTLEAEDTVGLVSLGFTDGVVVESIDCDAGGVGDDVETVKFGFRMIPLPVEPGVDSDVFTFRGVERVPPVFPFSDDAAATATGSAEIGA